MALRLPALAALALAASGHASAQVSWQTATEAAGAVVEIRARNCSEGPATRTGTGFAFLEPAKIVTARHVVAGCAEIELWYERAEGQPRRAARIERVLISRDLALLGVDAPPGASALRRAETVDKDAPLKAVGYAVGQPTLGDLDVTISIGGDRLADMLPAENRREISRDTAIDLSTAIYRFSKPLYPGMSGGPIFDRDGKVVAVVAGGLKSGAVAASWGWPASLLDELLRSAEPVGGGARTVATQFAYATEFGPQPTIRCGGLDLEKRPRLSFAEIAASSDNAAMLDRTVRFSTRPRAEIDALAFDVWVHRPSGATVVTPAGAELSAEGGGCVARSPDGVFWQVVWGWPAATQAEAHQASIAFENTMMTPIAMPTIGMVPDTVLTLAGPQARQDGLLVNRKAFFSFKAALGPGRASAVHLFETLMARGGSFVAVATVNTQVEQCLSPSGGWTLCAFDPAYVRQWSHFVLATQMSTYPIF